MSKKNPVGALPPIEHLVKTTGLSIGDCLLSLMNLENSGHIKLLPGGAVEFKINRELP